ncbi:MAG TPA: carboxypeptidase-like regulatory domain-containing protein, partial [Bacteroidales bacterium]|nr:carboxypeptidase-like regulatory domain-containing protein [Bacteroidales bacterium]
MMRILLLTFFALLVSKSNFSQGIEGRVTSTSGEPVSFATIYAAGVSKGTTSNIDGYFQLSLPEGKHTLTVRYLGYKTREMEVVCNGSTQKVDITLEEQLYKIPEVIVMASGEDPAYYIMRKAIAMSYYYLNQVEEYNC